jgi:hypothetical protein
MSTIRPATRPANPGDPVFGRVQAGDTVFVETRGGEQVSFVVQHIDGETLIATGGRRYANADLIRIERKEVSRAKTTGLIAAIAGGVYLVVGVTVGLWLGKHSQ